MTFHHCLLCNQLFTNVLSRRVISENYHSHCDETKSKKNYVLRILSEVYNWDCEEGKTDQKYLFLTSNNIHSLYEYVVLHISQTPKHDSFSPG